MAVKTITLDLEAYELLRRHKRGRQSFSQVVKDHFGPRKTIVEFRAALDDVLLSEESLDAMSARSTCARRTWRVTSSCDSFR